MGLFRLIGRGAAFGYRSTLKTGKQMIGWRGLAEGASFIRQEGARLNPRRKRAARTETFEQATRRLLLADFDLDAAFKLQAVLTWIYGAFILGVGLPAMAAFVITGQMGALLASGGFLLICFGLVFSSSFRAFQLRNEELCGVEKWLRRPFDWIPLSTRRKG